MPVTDKLNPHDVSFSFQGKPVTGLADGGQIERYGASSEPKIETLLNDAIREATRVFEGERACARVLKAMGAHAREVVLTQAHFGMWREWTITDARDLHELSCTFEIVLGDLVGAPRRGQYIAPRWDFSRTPLRFLVTSAAPPVLAP
jgi:hypothetical protein